MGSEPEKGGIRSWEGVRPSIKELLLNGRRSYDIISDHNLGFYISHSTEKI